jgi:hypothetical protein
LFGYRETYRTSIRPALGLQEPPTALAGTVFAGSFVDRMLSFYARVRRAVFYSLTRFEVEVIDRYQPERRYVSTSSLRAGSGSSRRLPCWVPAISAPAGSPGQPRS